MKYLGFLEQHSRNFRIRLPIVYFAQFIRDYAPASWRDSNGATSTSMGNSWQCRRNVVHGRVNRTKTDKTRRVDLSDEVLATFQDLLRRKKEEWMAQGKNEIPDWAFANSNGNAPDMQNIKNHYFFKCLQRAGLRRIDSTTCVTRFLRSLSRMGSRLRT